MASVNPYLTFNGNCEAAFDFYKSVFGGEYAPLVRFKDMPAGEHPMPDNAANLLAHVALPISKETVLMGSDTLEGFGPPTVAGNNFSISVNTGSEAEADKLFNGLSAGGHIVMPIGRSPWGSYFGMFTDKFGINWMVSFELEKK